MFNLLPVFHFSLKWIPLNNEFVVQKGGYQVNEAQVYIGRRNTFRISIGSVKQESAKSYVLISAVEFQDCSPPLFNSDPTSITCTDSQFQCTKGYGNCIPKSEVCDFQFDCEQNEDETNCQDYIGRCDFENIYMCEAWQFEFPDPRLTFISESGLHGLSYLPSIDHTYHSAKNFYLSFHSNLLANYLGQKSPNAQYTTKFVSVTFSANSTSDCK